MISGATIVYLAAADWGSPWHLSQEVAARLGAAGNRVLYVETLGWRRPRLMDLPRIAGRLRRAARHRGGGAPREVAPGVELVAPVVVPGVRSAPARALNRRLMLEILRRRGPFRLPLVVWAYTPSRLALDLVGGLPADLRIYYCTQGHAHRPHAPRDTPALERALIERVDAVITDGILLHRERAGLHPHVYRVPGGVEPADYRDARPPASLEGLPRPIVGYMGTVDHRIDPDLLEAIARAHPEWTVLVVGPVLDAPVERLAALPNVVMHGRVPVGEVPGVLATFDVGLMPYADLAMTRYTYPAKLHQYLAAALPIASTPLPDLEEFASLVETGTGPDGIVAAAERALAAPRRGPERRSTAAQHTWEARLEALSAIVEGHLAGQPPPSSEDFRGRPS